MSLDASIYPEYPRSEDDLKRWITDGVEESLTLDYKSKGALTKDSSAEISKDVSAMANSAGGVLVYGISEYPKDSPKAHFPEKIDPVDETKFSKEWLEHILSAGIQPRIADILIHPIRLSGGGSVYVVAVPQSGTAHQAVKLTRYFRRYNFESVPMQDHEIRDVMHRVRYPQVRLGFEIHVAKAADDVIPIRTRDDSSYRWLRISFSNVGERIAHHAQAKVMIPLSALGQTHRPIVKLNGVLYLALELDMALPDSRGRFTAIQKNSDPLLPKLDRWNTTVKLLATDKQFPDASIYFSVYADEAPVFKGQLPLSLIAITSLSELDGLVRDIDEPL